MVKTKYTAGPHTIYKFSFLLMYLLFYGAMMMLARTGMPTAAGTLEQQLDNGNIRDASNIRDPNNKKTASNNRDPRNTYRGPATAGRARH